MSERPFNPQVHAQRVLMVVSKNLSDSIAQFVHWTIGGFAAGFIYLLGQKALKVAAIEELGYLLMAVLIAGVIQRYIAMGVAAITKGVEEVETLNNPSNPTDAIQFLIVYIESLPRVVRWAAAMAANDVLEGNMMRISKAIFCATFLQSIIGLAIAIAVMRAVYLVVTTYSWVGSVS